MTLKFKALSRFGVHLPRPLKYKPLWMSRKNALIAVIRLPTKSSISECASSVPPEAQRPFCRLFSFRVFSTKQRMFRGLLRPHSGCNGYVVEIFGRFGFSLSEANFVFHTQHKGSVQISVFLDP